jgi:hypothetical protein
LIKLISLLITLIPFKDNTSVNNYVEKTYKEATKSYKQESKYFIQAKHGQIILKYIKVRGGMNCQIILLIGSYYNKQFGTFEYNSKFDKNKVSDIIWKEINM